MKFLLTFKHVASPMIFYEGGNTIEVCKDLNGGFCSVNMPHIDDVTVMRLEKASRLFFFIFLIVFFVINGSPLETFGQQYLGVENLSTGKEYETIQEAINTASIGDTIYVRNGTYYEHVVVNKTISLMGENKSNTIIDGEGSGNVIEITADDVSIKGFTIQNGGWTISQSCVYVDYSTGNKISDSIIKDSLYGIHLHYSSENSLLNNTVSGNGYGTRLTFTTNNVVSDNDFSNNTNGIWLYYSTNNAFSGNNVSSNTVYGLKLTASTDNVFSSNRVSNNTSGFFFTASTNNNLLGNNVSDNEQGFYFSASSYNTLSENNVSSNTVCGVWLGASSNNAFLNNYVVNNRNSFHSTTSYDNVIYHNNFINTQSQTIQQPVCIGSENFWDNGVEGNYWSNHTGSDINKDGISDTAYIIDEKNKDRYPLLGTFTQFDLFVENKIYAIDVVSNSTTSNFEYIYYPANRTAIVRFQVGNIGDEAFCRICIPNAVIRPPYTAIMNHNTSLYTHTVHSNETHSWLYITYYHPEYEPSIISLSSQERLALHQLWFWATIGLSVVALILLLLVLRYRKISNEQRKIIAAYEIDLKMDARKHLNTTRALFEADVKRRKAKIKEFETRYNVKIRPRNNFQDMLRTMEFKRKGKEKVAN